MQGCLLAAPTPLVTAAPALQLGDLFSPTLPPKGPSSGQQRLAPPPATPIRVCDGTQDRTACRLPAGCGGGDWWGWGGAGGVVEVGVEAGRG